jgi:hypothetical protein
VLRGVARIRGVRTGWRAGPGCEVVN